MVVWSKGGAQPLAQAFTFLCKKTGCGLFGVGLILTRSIPLSDRTLIEITNSKCIMLNFAMFLNSDCTIPPTQNWHICEGPKNLMLKLDKRNRDNLEKLVLS